MKNFKTIVLIAVLLVTATSCKKIKQRKPIIVNLSVVNAITKQGYPNIKWTVLQGESNNKLLGGADYTVFMEGYTDDNGKARIEFKRPMSHKLYYSLILGGLNESSGLPSGSEYISNNSNGQLEDKTEQDIVYTVGEKVNFVLHIKNTNCFDANDIYNIKFSNGIYTNYNYSVDDTFSGCYDHSFNQHLIEDYYPYSYTITRNGTTTTINDTLIVSKAMEGDTINIFY